MRIRRKKKSHRENSPPEFQKEDKKNVLFQFTKEYPLVHILKLTYTTRDTQ